MNVQSNKSTDSDNWAIDLRNVEKVYGRRVLALRGVSIRVRRGEIFGLLGPNGAGKSTLVKLMMTIVRPTRAEGAILGRHVGHKPTLAQVGYLPENPRFPKYLTGRQAIEFFGAMSKMARAARKRRAGELLETVGMSADAGRTLGTYSKGMSQRIGLAASLVNDPELVLLDEPTDGVDPIGRRDIRLVLRNLREQGKTVFINSHQLSELEMLCDRVAILLGGRVVKQGAIEDLSCAKARYEIEVEPGISGQRREQLRAAVGLPPQTKTSPPPLPTAPERTKLADGTWLELEQSVVRIGVTDATIVQPLIDAIRRTGLTIRRVQEVRPSLEDLFMDAVEGKGRAS